MPGNAVRLPNGVTMPMLGLDYDFELSGQEMAAIDAADRGERLWADPDHVTW